MYVIQRDDGKYVARPESPHTYTGRLQEAQGFRTRAEALRGLCDNERIIAVEDILKVRR